MVLFGKCQTALAAPSVPLLLFPPTPWSISETSLPLATALNGCSHHTPTPLPMFAAFAMLYPYPVWKLLRGAAPERGPSEIRVLLWGGVA